MKRPAGTLTVRPYDRNRAARLPLGVLLDTSLGAVARLLWVALGEDSARSVAPVEMPSRALLARALGVNEATIRVALGELIRAGYLLKFGACDLAGVGGRDRYVLLAERSRERPDLPSPELAP